MKISTINPTTGKVLTKYRMSKISHVPKYVLKSKRAFLKWGSVDIRDRLDGIRGIKNSLLKNKDHYSKLMALEMGKPIKEGYAEIEKCASLCDYYIRNSSGFLKEENIKTEYQKSYVKFEPMGVVAGIMPWNFPFWQFFRFAIPTLIAGNTILLKHSSYVAGCSQEIEEIFRANLPKDVMQNLVGDKNVAEAIISNPEVRGISFTGSTEVGKAIMKMAGDNLKKVVLELGGSDPFIVLEDADMDYACDNAIKGRFLNNGQSCIAAKRIIVHKKIYGDFVKGVIKRVSEMKVGDPLNETTDLGPLSNYKQLENIERQVNDSIRLGAKNEIGGKRIKREGFFFEPTILTNIPKNSPAYCEELFGPVMPIIKAKNDKQAIFLANDTEYGLGASIWAKDLKKAERYSKMINTGAVFINQVVRSDIRLPFGGMKSSGLGRELGSYGIKEFCNIKSIVVKKSG